MTDNKITTDNNNNNNNVNLLNTNFPTINDVINESPTVNRIPTSASSVWTSDLVYSEHMDLEIPGNILTVCNYLRANTDGNEFSILCKGSWDGNKYIVSSDYVIPLQKVDRVSVYYSDENLHEIRTQGYNVVIHCHPFKSSSFSGTDAATINAHFEVSILYSEQEFTTAIIPIRVTDEFTLQIKPKTIAVNWNIVETHIPENMLSNITAIKHKPIPANSRHNQQYIYNYYDRIDNFTDDITDTIDTITYHIYPRKIVNGIYNDKIRMSRHELNKVIDIEGMVTIITKSGDFATIPYKSLSDLYVYDQDTEAFIHYDDLIFE